jgi:hypothetical protein
MRTYYILIDKLDENWVDSSLRFQMIRALLECLKSIRKIHNLKVIVALRSDVRERVMQETSDVTFQREKFDDYAFTIRWNKPDLRQLVELRINQMFRLKYTGGPLGFSDLFPEKVGPTDTFDWMIERTLMRPRDIIAFINEAITHADGSTEISVSMLRKAEVTYAQKRRDALLQEWYSAFPTLNQIFDLITSGQTASSSFDEITGNRLDDFAISVASEPRIGHDPIHEICSTYVQSKGTSALRVLAEAAAIAYRVGAIGIKLRTGDPIIYSHLNEPVIAATALGPDTRIRLHPMLHGAYRLQESGRA